MPTIRARLLLNDNSRGLGSSGTAPLRFAYLKHEPFGPTYITDLHGNVRDKDGNDGIVSLTTWADLTVFCQNSVARVLHGNGVFSPVVKVRVSAPGGTSTRSVRTISTATSGVDMAVLRQFRLLNQIAETYHLVWRQFEPFQSLEAFPLGRVNNLETTRNRAKRIDVVYPAPTSVTAAALTGLASLLGVSLPPGVGRILSFVDPAGSGGWPRIYIEPDPPECRLFGGGGTYPNGNRRGLELVPAEIAHALHFSLLTQTRRNQVRRDYLTWLVSQIANGLAPTHAIGVPTTPMVAFIEAIDHFSHRFSEFARHRYATMPTSINDAARTAYVTAERDGTLTSNSRNCAGAGSLVRVAQTAGTGAMPFTGTTLSGGIDEGAILGALFVDLARRRNLRFVMEAVLASRRVDFGSFRNWFNANRASDRARLDAVVTRWGL